MIVLFVFSLIISLAYSVYFFLKAYKSDNIAFHLSGMLCGFLAANALIQIIKYFS